MNDFNKDMDRYLKKRKDGDTGINLNFKLKKEEPEDVKVENYQMLEEEIEAVEDNPELEEDEIQERKQGMLKRFFNKFKSEPEDIPMDEIEDMAPIVDEDVKQALRIGIKWIEKLPKTKLREFKQTGDADRYKDALIKYGIAKEK